VALYSHRHEHGTSTIVFQRAPVDLLEAIANRKLEIMPTGNEDLDLIFEKLL